MPFIRDEDSAGFAAGVVITLAFMFGWAFSNRIWEGAMWILSLAH